VEYLVPTGAHISACDNCAVRWASASDHLGVVQYLVSIGAYISRHDNCVVQ